jgi:hypothetical protein
MFSAWMNSIINSLNNREIASAIWLTLFVLLLSVYKPTRGNLAGIFKAFLRPVLLIPLTIAACYAAVEIILLHRFGWWSTANLKTSVLWLVTFAFVTMFEVATAKTRDASLGKITRDVVSVTGILVFITELHTFPLVAELIALPVVIVIVLTGEIAKSNPAHASVAKLLGCVAGAIVLSYFGFSAWKTVEAWREAATWSVASEFLIPVVLSLGFLPFLYGWRAYVAYSSMFTVISVIGIDKELVPFARWLAVTRIRGDLALLDRWHMAIQASRPSNKAELKHSLTALLALKSREAAPPTVPPNDGWSPYLAMQFITDLGLETGYYHHSFDDDWFASSPMREFGGSAVCPNNLAYYIDGSEHAATALKIKLNINDPGDRGEAEDMFIVHAMHLLEQAVSFDAVERFKIQIASLEAFQADIAFGCVSLTREAFVGGRAGGYSRKFEIRRGEP